MPSGSRAFFPFWYMSRNRHGERKGNSPFRYRLQEVRDGGPMTFLASALSSLGLHNGGPIFNLPPGGGILPGLSDRVDAGSLIVLATRPPVSDPDKTDEASVPDPGEDKKSIPRSGWNVETAILTFLRTRVLTYCSRAKIDFAGEVVRELPQDLKGRASLRFQTHDHANIAECMGRCDRPRPASENATSGFLVYAPHVTPWISKELGPGLLAAFGMGGLESLMWTAMLSTTYLSELSSLLSRHSAAVVYAEFVVPRDDTDAPPVSPIFTGSKAEFFEVMELTANR